jgi:hypothetical protein
LRSIAKRQRYLRPARAVKCVGNESDGADAPANCGFLVTTRMMNQRLKIFFQFARERFAS